MTDSEEVSALVHAYARHLDGRDVDSVVALFEHATWRSLPAGAILRGGEVRPVYERLLAQSGASTSKHLLTNLTVEVLPGATTASAHCYWTVLRSAPGEKIGIAISGQYHDTFEKVRGHWRFSDRLITVDITDDSLAS